MRTLRLLTSMLCAIAPSLVAQARVGPPPAEWIVRVYQLDGSVQCKSIKSISLAQAAGELTKLKIKMLFQAKRPLPIAVPTECGQPTGNTNYFVIAVTDPAELTLKDSSPSAFHAWPEDGRLSVVSRTTDVGCSKGRRPMGANTALLQSVGIQVLEQVSRRWAPGPIGLMVFKDGPSQDHSSPAWAQYRRDSIAYRMGVDMLAKDSKNITQPPMPPSPQGAKIVFDGPTASSRGKGVVCTGGGLSVQEQFFWIPSSSLSAAEDAGFVEHASRLPEDCADVARSGASVVDPRFRFVILPGRTERGGVPMRDEVKYTYYVSPLGLVDSIATQPTLPPDERSRLQMAELRRSTFSPAVRNGCAVPSQTVVRAVADTNYYHLERAGSL